MAYNQVQFINNEIIGINGLIGIGGVLRLCSAELLLVWQLVGAGRTRVAEGSQELFLVFIGKTGWDFFWEK